MVLMVQVDDLDAALEGARAVGRWVMRKDFRVAERRNFTL